jgi:hypothetical protein
LPEVAYARFIFHLGGVDLRISNYDRAVVMDYGEIVNSVVSFHQKEFPLLLSLSDLIGQSRKKELDSPIKSWNDVK